MSASSAGRGGRTKRARTGHARPTMRDVATMAGVSVGTVSKVINDAPGVSEETRSRVLTLIRAVDYHPNASAQSLVAGRTGSIGLIIPHTGQYSMSGAYWPTLLTAVTEKAAARSLNVLLSTAESEQDVDSAYKSILRGRRVDGLIVGGEQFGQKQLVELQHKGFPFVLVGRSPFVSHCHVEIENAGGAEMMTRHLVNVGHKNVVLFAGPTGRTAPDERVAGYKSVVMEAGLPPRIHHFNYFDAELGPALRSALASLPLPCAVFAAAGDLVVPVLVAARDLGLSVPEDVALGVFDDHPFYAFFKPPVTAVSQPVREIGEAAVDLLFALMEGSRPRSLVLPTRLVVRGSCGAPRL